MFERYAESAKRVIFFAQHEASCTHSETIEPAHILLGLIREHPGLLPCFLSMQAIAEIEADARRLVSGTKEVPTSVELPLSEAGKEVLRQAEEESSESVAVYPVDLLVGLLRETKSGAVALLARRPKWALRLGAPPAGPSSGFAPSGANDVPTIAGRFVATTNRVPVNGINEPNCQAGVLRVLEDRV